MIATPQNLTTVLKAAKSGDVIQLAGGNYNGQYVVEVPGLTLEPVPNEYPLFTGNFDPPAPGDKTVWLHVTPAAKGTVIRNLSFVRDADVAGVLKFNDYGVVVEAPDVTLDGCRLAGMVKGVHIKDRTSTGVAVVNCHVGPTYQSNVVVGTSYGVVRGGLIAHNLLELSYIEDGIQFTQNFALPPLERLEDVSNLGMVIRDNRIQDQAENGVDLKGAGKIVIERNVFRRIAGSNDGPLEGWNTRSPFAIMHGARTTSGEVVIRNNDIEECAGGIRVYPGWIVYNNRVANNNFSRTALPWAGSGLFERGGFAGSLVANNLVYGHKGKDLDFVHTSTAVFNNPAMDGPGAALTRCVGSGSGKILRVSGGNHFTDYFGRTDVSRDVVWVNGAAHKILGVGPVNLELDSELTWVDGDPVFWLSPQPVAGIQPDYTPPPPPPPPEPVAVDVALVLSLTATPEQAELVKALLEAGSLHFSVTHG